MSRRVVQYERLRTLADVRAERYRVNREINRTKEKLVDDYEDCKHMLTLDYWVGRLTKRVSSFTASPTAQWIFMGYNMISSFIQRRKEAKEEKAERDEEELEREVEAIRKAVVKEQKEERAIRKAVAKDEKQERAIRRAVAKETATVPKRKTTTRKTAATKKKKAE